MGAGREWGEVVFNDVMAAKLAYSVEEMAVQMEDMEAQKPQKCYILCFMYSCGKYF
jgi:hypothetical protein